MNLEGDHIGYHYDTSFYNGERFTVLIGIVDNSSCKLKCSLYTKCPEKTVEEQDLVIAPGDLVVFNGGKLWHSVTPLQANEERIILTLEYVTCQEISFINRTINNVKDSISYFGIGSLLGKYEGYVPSPDASQNSIQSELPEDFEDEENAKQNQTSLIVFVNRRSGGQRGGQVIRELRKFTGKLFVYDLDEDGGPHKGY